MAVDDLPRVHDAYTLSYVSHSAVGLGIAFLALDVLAHERADGLGECLVLLVFDHDGGNLRVQSVENHYVAVAHLVEYRDDASLAERGVLACLDDRDVRDETAVSDAVVVDAASYPFDETVVAHGDVAQAGMADATVFAESLADLYVGVVSSQLYLAVKFCVSDVFGGEALVHCYPSPIFCRTALLLEGVDFFACQFAHVRYIVLSTE